MTTPTIKQASDYVRATEATWGSDTTVILKTGLVTEGMRVVTSNGYDWVVWVQADGTIYGEC